MKSSKPLPLLTATPKPADAHTALLNCKLFTQIMLPFDLSRGLFLPANRLLQFKRGHATDDCKPKFQQTIWPNDLLRSII
jgi:hypothetical protein